MHFITEVENSPFYFLLFFFSILFERNVQSKIIKKRTKWNERAEVLTSRFSFIGMKKKMHWKEIEMEFKIF